MRFHFLPMTAEYAGCILTRKYPPPFDWYDNDKASGAHDIGFYLGDDSARRQRRSGYLHFALRKN